jgi:hypothetical protein
MYPRLVFLLVGWYVANNNDGRAKLLLSQNSIKLGRSLALPYLFI